MLKTDPIVVYQITPDCLDELIDRVTNRAADRFSIDARTATQDNEELFDVTSLAHFLGLKKSSIYARPDLPKVKRGKKNYYLRSDILLWLKSGRQETSVEIDKEVDDDIKKSVASKKRRQ